MKIRVAWTQLASIVLLLLTTGPAAQGQSQKLFGMWSDNNSLLGLFCFGSCTDAGIERLNKLLDDPANDARSFEDITAEAQNFERETYIKPKLIGDARKKFPMNPLEDPSYLQCVPWGFAHQIFAPHQLEITQRDNSRIEMRYGEWDARRTVFLNSEKAPRNPRASLLGISVGHWEGEALVIETSGITANIVRGTTHSDQLRVLERYTRSQDGKTLQLTATLEDPVSFSEPIVLKKVWSWSPQSKIYPYTDCERPTGALKGAKPQ